MYLPLGYGCQIARPWPCKQARHRAEPRDPGARTILGEEVDQRVGLAVPVKLGQLAAAVHRQVVDTEPSLPPAAGVEHGTLQGFKGGRGVRGQTSQDVNMQLIRYTVPLPDGEAVGLSRLLNRRLLEDTPAPTS